MKILAIALLISLSLTGCVSQSKYNDLKLQKEKLTIKTEKLNDKLKNLTNYQQHLLDSLNNNL